MPERMSKDMPDIFQKECHKLWRISGFFLADVAWQLHFNPKILDMISTECSKHVTSDKKCRS
jgi:hypothetical protein